VRVVPAVIFLVVIALVPALIARRKGLGFWTYYAFGLLCWAAAVPVAIVLKDKRHVRAD
jgi:hypothetical protein